MIAVLRIIAIWCAFLLLAACQNSNQAGWN